jgi:Helicase associated domain
VKCGKDKNAPHRQLAMWLQSQRKCFKNRQHKAATGTRRFAERGSLSDERLVKLTSLGVTFQDPFELRLQDLTAYKNETGHLRVPTRYKGHNNLGPFVEHVKRQYRKKQLPVDKVEKLEAMGMDWGPPVTPLPPPPPPPVDDADDANVAK